MGGQVRLWGGAGKAMGAGEAMGAGRTLTVNLTCTHNSYHNTNSKITCVQW